MRVSIAILLVCVASVFGASIPAEPKHEITDLVLQYTQSAEYVLQLASSILGPCETVTKIAELVQQVQNACIMLNFVEAKNLVQSIISLFTNAIGYNNWFGIGSITPETVASLASSFFGKRQLNVSTILSHPVVQGILNHPTVQGILAVITSGKRQININTILSHPVVQGILSHPTVQGILAVITNGKRQLVIPANLLSLIPANLLALIPANINIQQIISLVSGSDIQGIITDVLALVNQGKRSAEDERIIATITSTLSNLWAGLHPTIMPHVDNLLAEMLSHVGNAGQSLLGAISGISGAVTGGKRSAEDQKIIDALAGVLGGHLSEILNHGQLIAANIASTFLQNLLASLPGKRSVEEERLIANVMGAISSAQAGNWAQVATHVGNIFNIVGKRSVEEQRIIATITSTLSNLWAGLHPTIMPHVDNLLAEMLSHVGNAGASLLGAISGISGAVGGY